MYSTCLHFLHRRYQPSSNFLTDSTRSKKFQNSFIKRGPGNRTLLQYFHTNLLVPNQIKSPSCLQKQICFLPITFCTKRQRPYKYISLKQSQSYSSLRQGRHPNRNHMAADCLCSSRSCYDAISPKVSSPTNQGIAQLITPKHTPNCQNTQREYHSQRHTRCPQFRFTSIIRCIEHSHQNSKAISTCQTSDSHLNQMTIGSCRSRSSPRQFQDSIFTVISSQEWPTKKAQTPLKQTSPGLGQRTMCSSRASHILHISTSMDNYTSSQEQQCFKASVSHLMIHCQSVMTLGQGNYHVSQLTTGTISNNTFHIILNQSHSPPHQTSDSSYPQKDYTCINTTFPNPVCTSNQENSGSYLSGSMNQSRDRCGSFHPVSQPNMQTNLCTFSQSSSLLCKANPICIKGRSTCCCLQRSISTSLIPPTKKQTSKQNSITDTVYLHCLLCSFGPTQTMKPKTNQQIATYTNHFPTYQECTQIICCYQQQHRTSKQTQVTLKTRQMRIMLHISQTINMYTETYSTYSYHHRSTLRINTEEPIYRYCMSIKPTSQRNDYCRTHRPNFIKDEITQKGTCSQTKNSHTSTTTST
jgi:hypothetical protein